MIDIDYFKKVNDTYGHPIGDKVLIDVSRIIKENVRGCDLVGRYGGEEFLIIFVESDSREAFIAIEKIRKMISEYDFSYIEGNITISGGVCQFTTEENDIVKIADENLYKAKNSGRNKIV